MSRRKDWEARLNALLARRLRAAHAYGRHDCMTFFADAVKAQTGKDFGRGHRGKYRSALSAAKYLKRLGHDASADMVADLLPEIPVARAGRGDIVIDGEGIPGVVIGHDALFVGMKDGVDGLVRQPRPAWTRAFRV
jgi:hypothetical protein